MNNSSIDTHSLGALLNTLTDSDSIYVIPGTGCGNCIGKALKFAKKQKNNRNLYFVITRIQDVKIVKNHLDIVDADTANIYFDKENRLSGFGYTEIYPFLFNRGSIYYLTESDFENN
jgi:hypothetical protein